MKNKKSFLLGLILIFGITIGRTTVSTDIEMAFPVSNLKLHSTSPSLSSSPYISDNLFQTKPSSIISSIINTNKIKIGFVTPVFTNAAYNHKFYIFYSRYALTPFGINITKDISLLNSRITISPNQGLSDRSQFAILSDLDVDKGYIFDNIDGSGHNSAAGAIANLYDMLILGHQEYVTQKEYDNLKQFVSNGGTMILLDGNVFYAEVKYFENNNTISLVKGHGWAYNGKTAWRSIDERWKNETSQWVGSNYLCDLCIKSFKNDPFGYLPHEEQYITNSNDKILLNFEPVESSTVPPKSKVSIAAYSLDYGKGHVISFGIYSDDVMKNAIFDRFFYNIIINSLLHNI